VYSNAYSKIGKKSEPLADELRSPIDNICEYKITHYGKRI